MNSPQREDRPRSLEPRVLVPPSVTKTLIGVAIWAMLAVPFLSKPIHVDDANFLMLAEGAALDPWRPHNIRINWSGVVEPAYDILSNPPGIAWFLAPVRNQSEPVMHLWMMLWLLPAIWGCHRLGRVYTDGHAYIAAIYLLTCPVIVLASQALTPDLPMFACTVAGVGGFVTVRQRAWLFALLAGCAALFRYSGITVIPMLVLIGLVRGGWRMAAVALLAALPILALFLHDWHAYGEVHLQSVFAWQNDPAKKSLARGFGNLVAGMAMLGGAAVLPVLVWRRESIAGAILGAALGFNAAYFSGLTLAGTIPTVLFTAAGGAAIALAAAPQVRELTLSVWALGGTIFFFITRFAAARYWAAFLPGVGLLAIRNAQQSRRWLITGIAVNIALSLAMAVDDQNHARAQKTAALKVAEYGTGNFSGHWGWQHYLERAGWVPMERDGSPEQFHARSRAASQQLPNRSSCLELIERFHVSDSWPGPRLYAPFGEANYHAAGGTRFVPWTLSNEPYEVISLYRRCN